MSRVRRIAAHELRLMARSRVSLIALGLLLLLALVAGLTSAAQRDADAALRQRFQAQADRAFDGQPARHPHRMVHYGTFVFRPAPALAAFDPGVDRFTGNTIFLEGHRQNSANFGDVRQSSLLARFGQLTPAFVLSVLAPLVLVFVGYGAIAREREGATWRVLAASGVSPARLLAGKGLALLTVAGLMLLPAAVGLGWLVAGEGASALVALGLLAAYGLYLGVWVAAVLGISALCAQARLALLSLLGVWALACILVPRVAPDVAVAAAPLPTKLETDITIAADLRKMGDSHNPDDPHFAAFKASVLKRYGVTRVEDLPVNYGGLLGMEGERMTSSLFNTYAQRQAEAEQRQSQIAGGFALVSPLVALREVSMALAGTDLAAHRAFLMQAEAYRYALVQGLNRLQAEAVTYADDKARNKDPEAARRVRIDASHWHDMPDFAYQPLEEAQRWRMAAGPLAWLAGWMVLVIVGLAFARRRLGEVM